MRREESRRTSVPSIVKIITAKLRCTTHDARVSNLICPLNGFGNADNVKPFRLAAFKSIPCIETEGIWTRLSARPFI
ncbi:MAG: hypothetical protein ABIA63_15400, partial [bacterium]